jgi:exodeoxyribonuclease VII large subunit
VESILGQLRVIREMSSHFDVVVIIRGGGGDVGLNCYDHYNLAKEVATFPLPVLTGIGHSTNETVVEMVSGQNLITPTDVAYFIIQKFHNFSVHLQELTDAVVDFSTELMEAEKRRSGEAGRRLVQGTKLGLEEGKRRKGDMGKRLVMGTRLLLDKGKRRQGDLGKELMLGAKLLLAKQGMQLAQKEEQLRLMDPVNILKRGYSITYANGKVLRDSSDIQPGEEIVTHLFNGTIKSEVKSKSK